MTYKCEETIYTEELRFEAWNILSATQSNPLNQSSIDYHSQFPMENCAPILGHLSVIDEDDVGEKEFIDGRIVTSDDIGLTVFKVERGHHRSFVGSQQGIKIPCALTN